MWRSRAGPRPAATGIGPADATTVRYGAEGSLRLNRQGASKKSAHTALCFNNAMIPLVYTVAKINDTKFDQLSSQLSKEK